jgi:hypothetical protein
LPFLSFTVSPAWTVALAFASVFHGDWHQDSRWQQLPNWLQRQNKINRRLSKKPQMIDAHRPYNYARSATRTRQTDGGQAADKFPGAMLLFYMT